MRLAFKVSESTAQNIDFYAQKFGISKSAFVAVAVGQYINQLQKQDDLMATIQNSMSGAVKNAIMENAAQDDDYAE